MGAEQFDIYAYFALNNINVVTKETISLTKHASKLKEYNNNNNNNNLSITGL